MHKFRKNIDLVFGNLLKAFAILKIINRIYKKSPIPGFGIFSQAYKSV